MLSRSPNQQCQSTEGNNNMQYVHSSEIHELSSNIGKYFAANVCMYV